jgi:hypothetical protein
MPPLGYAKYPAFREEEEAEDELVLKEKEKRKSMPIVMVTAQAEVNKGEIERIELVARKPRLMVIDEPHQGTEALVVAAHAGRDAAEKAENPSEELRESSYSYIPPLKSLTSIIEDVECVLGNMNDSFVSERPRRTDTGESMYSEMDMETSNQRTNAEGKTSVKEDTNLPGSSSLFYDIRKALALDEDEEDDIYECYAKDESQNGDDDQWTDDPAVVWPNLTSEEIAGGYRELIGALEIAPV